MNIDASMLVAQFVSGLCRGMILFLMASGLTLVFGVMRVINFAHGSFYMLSAYMAYSITQFFMGHAYGFWIALIVVPLAVGAVGGIVECSAAADLRKRTFAANSAHLCAGVHFQRFRETNLGS